MEFYKDKKSGFAIMFAIVAGSILLILSLSLYSFVNQQHTGIQHILNGEAAHFLAEAGISNTIRNLRDLLAAEGLKNNPELFNILTQPSNLDDTDITHLFSDSWRTEIENFAREIDSTAEIKIKIWLRDFKQTEISPNKWFDPGAKKGKLTIESTGYYKNSQRTIAIKRDILVANVIPPFVSKFTLYVKNASEKGENSFNLIRNDYKGMITDGPRPLICYNNNNPESPFSPKDRNSVLKAEQNPKAYKNRGWIWLGNKKTRLNLCSGAGDLGEIFQFYDVTNPNIFKPIKFSSPLSGLPKSFRKVRKTYWDKKKTEPRKTTYKFGHSFILDGFHDRSNRKKTDAMYEGGILSSGERKYYSSKSSILHIYGDARRGFQSRTKVFGPVYSAFPRFANLEIMPQEKDVLDTFQKHNPPPLYLLPSISSRRYSNSAQIKDIMNRKVGGPLLKYGMLFSAHNIYARYMSRIIEVPYNLTYNSMQDIYTNQAIRTFPAQNEILKQDSGRNITLKNGEQTIYKGNIAYLHLDKLIQSRVQAEVATIKEFWETYLNKNNELELNQIVKIKNTAKEELIIPPLKLPTQLKFKGAGMIILEQGNLSLRSIKLDSDKDCISLYAPNCNSIRFLSTGINQINIIAPKARLDYSSKLYLAGTLCISSIYADQRFQGGKILFREAIDPTSKNYFNFYRAHISEKDSYWFE